MSFLFHHKTKKVINKIWGVVALFVALGMVLLYAQGFLGVAGSGF